MLASRRRHLGVPRGAIVIGGGVGPGDECNASLIHDGRLYGSLLVILGELLEARRVLLPTHLHHIVS